MAIVALLTTTFIIGGTTFFLSSGGLSALELGNNNNNLPPPPLAPASPQPEPTRTGFENFLHQAINEYPAWLTRNNLDPLRERQKVFNLNYQNDFVNLNGSLWNDTFQGHSTGGRFILSQVNLLEGNFKIQRFGGNLSLWGEYEVEGNIIFSGASIRGAGEFVVRQFNESNAMLEVNGFGMTPDGFIDLSKANITDDQNVYLWIDHFQGLEAGGHKKDLENLIFKIYDDAFDLSIEYRMTTYLLRYLKEIFAKVNIDSIIATLPPPQSSSALNQVTIL